MSDRAAAVALIRAAFVELRRHVAAAGEDSPSLATSVAKRGRECLDCAGPWAYGVENAKSWGSRPVAGAIGLVVLAAIGRGLIQRPGQRPRPARAARAPFRRPAEITSSRTARPAMATDFGPYDDLCVNHLYGYGRGKLKYNPDCTWDTSDCKPAICGNGVVDYSYEDCDGTDLSGQTCANALGGRGYVGGTLKCDATCRFDFLGCATDCGNGTVDSEVEQCDGTNLGAYASSVIGTENACELCVLQQPCDHSRAGSAGL